MKPPRKALGRPPIPDAEVQAVADLYNRRFSNTEICTRLNLRKSSLSRRIKLARKQGLIRPLHNTIYRGLKIGGFRARLREETATDFLHWLVENTPTDGTLVDLLLAIAKDAYAEEQESQENEE